jgi:signal peptidase II
VTAADASRPDWHTALRRPEPWWLLALVVLDQLTKWIVSHRVPLYETVVVVPGLLNLTHVRNTGAAFGVLNSADFAYKPVVVALLATAALLALLWYARQVAHESWATRYAFVLIIAGAVGNLIDRATVGYVLDFVDVVIGGWHFWAFNVADAAITVGAILFFADALLLQRHVSETV